MESDTSCPECGALNNTCETRYHECLAKEFTEAGYGAVHHLTVATYMLQHSSKLSSEGWLFERKLLRDFLVENKTPEAVRHENKDQVDSGRREFKIAAKDGRPKIERRKWTRTVLDVRLGDPRVYCSDVTAWARSALEDAKDLAIQES